MKNLTAKNLYHMTNTPQAGICNKANQCGEVSSL